MFPMSQPFAEKPGFLRRGLPSCSAFRSARCRTGSRAVGLPLVPQGLCWSLLTRIPTCYSTLHNRSARNPPWARLQYLEAHHRPGRVGVQEGEPVKRQGLFKLLKHSGNTEVKARATEDGFEFPPQAMPDGSVIHPESDYKEPLFKSILLDKRLQDAVLTQEKVQVYDSFTKVVVGFFGSIAYMLIAPPLEQGILQRIADTYQCPDIMGVEFQQDLQKGTLGFWALLPDGKNQYIGPKRSA